jgi:hypothetical protein
VGVRPIGLAASRVDFDIVGVDRRAARVREVEGLCHRDAGPAGTRRSDDRYDAALLVVRAAVDVKGLAHGQAGDARHLDIATARKRGGQSGGGRRGERPVVRQEDVGVPHGVPQKDEDELVIVRRSSNRRVGNGDRLADRVCQAERGRQRDAGRPDR